MTFTAIEAGRIAGRRAKLDGRWGLTIHTESGAQIGSVRIHTIPQQGKRGLVAVGTIIEAASGEWYVSPDGAGWAVTGIAGVPAGRVTRLGRHDHELRVPAGAVVWQQQTLRPQYQVNGLYSASRTALHKVAIGVARRMFSGEITPALVARDDGGLVLLLSAWLTWRAIESKAQAERAGGIGSP